MRGNAAAALVAGMCTLTACYSPALRDCEITCASGTCPSGFECRDNVCRAAGESRSCSEVLADASIAIDAAPDGDPGADTDKDTVNDDRDNCRSTPNADQANEDADALGDACDLCPILDKWGTANLDANLDGDSDGVGDGCDPYPSTPGDRLLYFHGFSSTPPGIVSTGSSGAALWSFAGGRATTSLAAGAYANVVFPVPMLMLNARQTRVSTKLHLIAYVGSATRGAGLAVFDSSAIGVFCALGMHTTPTGSLMCGTLNGGGVNVNTEEPTAAAAGTVSTLVLTKQGALISSTNGQVTTQVQSTVNATVLGLHARSTQAAADYILVIDSPMP